MRFVATAPTSATPLRRFSTKIPTSYQDFVPHVEELSVAFAVSQRRDTMEAAMVPILPQPRQIWTILRTAVLGFMDDNALSRAAAIAFYAATSLAPILLIVIAIAGIAVGRDAAQLAVSAQLAGLLGPQGADLLKSVVQGA